LGLTTSLAASLICLSFFVGLLNAVSMFYFFLLHSTMPKLKYASTANEQWLDQNNHPTWTSLHRVDGDNQDGAV